MSLFLLKKITNVVLTIIRNQENYEKSSSSQYEEISKIFNTNNNLY